VPSWHIGPRPPEHQLTSDLFRLAHAKGRCKSFVPAAATKEAVTRNVNWQQKGIPEADFRALECSLSSLTHSDDGGLGDADLRTGSEIVTMMTPAAQPSVSFENPTRSYR